PPCRHQMRKRGSCCVPARQTHRAHDASGSATAGCRHDGRWRQLRCRLFARVAARQTDRTLSRARRALRKHEPLGARWNRGPIRWGRRMMEVLRELERARRDGHAILAANFYNAETLLAVLRAARRTNSPVILQTSPATLDYLGVEQACAMACAAAHELG